MKTIPTLLLTVCLFASAIGYVNAQTITGLGDSVYPATTDAPGSGSDYYFLSYNGENSSFSSVGTPSDFDVTPVGLFYADNGDTDATTPSGTSFQTGIDYTNAPTGGNLLNFTITNPDELDFNVYVLTNNSGDYRSAVDSPFTLTSSGSASSGTVTSVTGSAENDEYLEFTVRDASPGETFTLSSSLNSAYIGGITFDAVPEPATWALLSVALGGLFLVRHRILS